MFVTNRTIQRVHKNFNRHLLVCKSINFSFKFRCFILLIFFFCCNHHVLDRLTFIVIIYNDIWYYTIKVFTIGRTICCYGITAILFFFFVQITLYTTWHIKLWIFVKSFRRHIPLHNNIRIQRIQIKRNYPIMHANLWFFNIAAFKITYSHFIRLDLWHNFF